TGACVQCRSGASCQPSGKPCNNGALDCSTGTPTCVDAQTPAPDGTPCSSGQHCLAGTCTTLPNTLSIVSGDAQSGYTGAVLGPVVLRLVDGSNKAVAGETLTVTAPPGAAATPVTAKTDLNGRITVVPQLGTKPGPHTFTVRSPTAGTVAITATATAPPAGKSYALINRDQADGNSTQPTPAPDARMREPIGLAVASDGTIYIGDLGAHRVRVMRPDGTVEVLAGTGTFGFAGDFGPARDARLYNPGSIALDEANKLLYVADSDNDRVRVIDLSTPANIIRTIAGGGSIGAPTYGDGSLATSAILNTPAAVGVGPDGALYISDYKHDRIRRVDPTTQVITTVLAAGGCASKPVALSSCNPGACRMVWNAAGEMLISGDWCGTSISGGSGIARLDSNGDLHLVGGGVASNASLGRDARVTAMQPWWLAIDSAGNVIYSETGSHRVRRIDAVTHIVSNVAGTGTAGKAGPFSDAASSPVNEPRELRFLGDDLLLADGGNHSVRLIPVTDIKTPSVVQLAIDSGDNQTPLPAQLPALPLKVKVTQGAQPLQGVRVDFAKQDLSMWLSAQNALTDGSGVALASARVGIAPGNYTVQAELRDIHGKHVSGSPKTFTIAAATPSAGTIFTIFNINRVGTSSDLSPGPSTLRYAAGPRGVAAASDGTIYASVAHVVLEISARGELEVIAGGTYGFSGDTGPATSGRFDNPGGLALDETRKLLYIADTSNRRVRVIDLVSQTIDTAVGGGGSTNDLVPGKSTLLHSPRFVALDASGNVYFSDEGYLNVRVLDVNTKLVRTVLQGGGGCSGTLRLDNCSTATNCPIVAAASGGVYLGGQFCGSAVGGTTTYAVAHVAADGTLTHVAGNASGSSADGTSATGFKLAGAQGLARDGNTLYLGNGNTSTLAITIGGTVKRFAGTGSAGSGGDYGPATSATLTSNNAFAVTPGGHLVISDGNADVLRLVW
ncbi:MAG: hypothetical protein KC503_20745, partial [Myxococcales bacterium]|nr:hypothetical protein [Myxococcales bacterium]